MNNYTIIFLFNLQGTAEAVEAMEVHQTAMGHLIQEVVEEATVGMKVMLQVAQGVLVLTVEQEDQDLKVVTAAMEKKKAM